LGSAGAPALISKQGRHDFLQVAVDVLDSMFSMVDI